MKSKGYSCIDDFCGKLKPYQKGAKFKPNKTIMMNDNKSFLSRLINTYSHMIITILIAIIIYLVVGEQQQKK